MSTQCPNCQSHWGLEEMDWQQCDCCGYPNHNECSECIGECTCVQFDDEDDDPNDSRNL